MHYPDDHPGRFANLTYISIYGTTCAAWDQMPETPGSAYCANNADWCHSQFNWCQLPWCFVGEGCSSRLAMQGFGGSSAAFYSYDTCLSAPDCRTMPFDESCPFDSKDTSWSTAKQCPDSWSDVCECQFQGSVLPQAFFMQYPMEEPGKVCPHAQHRCLRHILCCLGSSAWNPHVKQMCTRFGLVESRLQLVPATMVLREQFLRFEDSNSCV